MGDHTQNMATENHVASSSDSSDSDSEETQRLRDAAVDSSYLDSASKRTVVPSIATVTNNVEPGAKEKKARVAPNKPSLRPRDDGDEEESWALETTPEFRKFVAKKLSAIVDDDIGNENHQQCAVCSGEPTAIYYRRYGGKILTVTAILPSS